MSIIFPMTTASVLVVDGDTALGTCLVRLYRDAGVPVAATHPPADSSDEPSHPDILRISWAPPSPVSARNVLLQTLHVFNDLHTVVFPCAPEIERTLLHETPLKEIEAGVDRWIRGSLFLLREVLIHLSRQGSGRLVLVHHSPRESTGVPPPLEATIRSAFAGLATSLLASYGDSVDVVSFESSSSRIEELAAYVYDTLENGARAHRGRLRRRRRRYVYRSRPMIARLRALPVIRRFGTS